MPITVPCEVLKCHHDEPDSNAPVVFTGLYGQCVAWMESQPCPMNYDLRSAATKMWMSYVIR